MASENAINIGLANGMLPDCAKPLAEQMLTYHQWGSVAFTWAISDKMLKTFILDMSLKITNLRLQLHFSWANWFMQ